MENYIHIMPLLSNCRDVKSPLAGAFIEGASLEE